MNLRQYKKPKESKKEKEEIVIKIINESKLSHLRMPEPIVVNIRDIDDIDY